MLRGAVWVLRQRRYMAFAAVGVLVAIGCVAAGTWQIQRFEQSVHGNRALLANAKAAPVALSPALVPVTGPAPGRLAVQYRTVRASGHYVRGADTFLTGQFRGKKPGFDVLTPLRTPSGTLLVDRGFVAAGAHGSPKQPPAAPGGAVTVLGRLNPVTSGSASTAPQGVNGIRQAVSVRAPSIYRAYVTLDKGQPGGQGLVAAPAPNRSNPYGGAYEWQHFAYIVQWYLFALLALLAPFLVARNEVRDARRRWLGIDPADIEIDDLPELAPSSGARLELPAASAAELPALRQAAAIERVQRVAPERLEQARRNADRYGRSLGPDDGSSLFPNWRRNRRDLVPTTPVTDSSRTPHRSDDAHHAAYNDYLWQLAMADGDIPDVEIGPRSPVDEDE